VRRTSRLLGFPSPLLAISAFTELLLPFSKSTLESCVDRLETFRRWGVLVTCHNETGVGYPH
jgi:hypothetical protein